MLVLVRSLLRGLRESQNTPVLAALLGGRLSPRALLRAEAAGELLPEAQRRRQLEAKAQAAERKAREAAAERAGSKLPFASDKIRCPACEAWGALYERIPHVGGHHHLGKTASLGGTDGARLACECRACGARWPEASMREWSELKEVPSRRGAIVPARPALEGCAVAPVGGWPMDEFPAIAAPALAGPGLPLGRRAGRAAPWRRPGPGLPRRLWEPRGPRRAGRPAARRGALAARRRRGAGAARLGGRSAPPGGVARAARRQPGRGGPRGGGRRPGPAGGAGARDLGPAPRGGWRGLRRRAGRRRCARAQELHPGQRAARAPRGACSGGLWRRRARGRAGGRDVRAVQRSGRRAGAGRRGARGGARRRALVQRAGGGLRGRVLRAPPAPRRVRPHAWAGRGRGGYSSTPAHGDRFRLIVNQCPARPHRPLANHPLP
ncbi:unnamed protein product [Prorocentrum cordatum]|uniref:Uncharacterized protein n=1 Tax=Prorocentrum cordatum TaxID=2364126 RepID=A0ABN9T262_9DINO|nr:unnamed protein product [Polarella glacialis]